MRKLLIILVFISTQILCFGQSNDLPDRETFTLKIAVDESNTYQTEILKSPFILPDNIIQIYPGEEIFVEVELDNKVIKSMKTVQKNINPEKTITISFLNHNEYKKNQQMSLAVYNPFSFQLIYKAKMLSLNRNYWVDTSIWPVYPKLFGFETWPNIIISLKLSDWEFK